MKLPQTIIAYCTAKLWAVKNSTTTYLSKFVDKSHDYLTRSLKHKISWKPILARFLKKYDLSTGYFIFDETEEDKSYAKKITGLSWIYSHLKGRFIFGLQLVVICWTDGNVKIPFGWKIYKKKKCKDDLNHKTKPDLAMELLQYALTEICSNPVGILFDIAYSSEKMLKYINNQGLKFYGQVKSNRNLDHQQVRYHNNGRPYWEKIGKLTGNIKVKVVKHRRKYYISNDIESSGKEIRARYKIRWKIEDINRFCKKELDLEGCQMRNLRSQNNHIGICFYLFSALQDIAEKTQMTDYALREQASIDRSFDNFPELVVHFS
jgi:hypothetical protein